MARKKQTKQKQRLIKASHVLKNLPLEDRTWDKPLVLQVNKEKWSQKGRVLVGSMARFDYFSPGFRHGLLEQPCKMFAEKGVHFIKIAGIARKEFFKQLLSRRIAEAKTHIEEQRSEAKAQGHKVAGISNRDIVETVTENIVNEAAKALCAMLPRIKKPDTTTKYVRYYITTSKRYDGDIGERIALRLQKLRQSDIRKYHPGSIRTELKGSDIVFWTLCEMKSRIPGQFVSQAIEKIIRDKEAETSRKRPDLWVVGGNGTAIYTPAGVHQTAYVGTPSVSVPEGVSIGENQIGFTIIEQEIKNRHSRIIRFYNLRDAVSREREMITGIKSGSKQIHRDVVDALKREGGTRSVGQLADILHHDRKQIEDALHFLKESTPSERKTWPGLNYDEPSQLWDFHREWIQQRLRYVLPSREQWAEDNLFFFACMHAGYTASDYVFIVNEFPKIILQRNIQTVVGLGDFIAGLHHNFLCSGEVFSGLNNTEQEEFAAALIATVFYKVFATRLGEFIKQGNIKDAAGYKHAVSQALMDFVYIPGNHDLWQQQEGSTPLKIFHGEFVRLLSSAIIRNLAALGVPMMDIHEILNKKLFAYEDIWASHMLASGLKLGMLHPHMGGAITTSRNAQNMMGAYDSQIGGLANFHRGTVVHRWDQTLGQCVVVQVGTMAIYTPFEVRKMKLQNDFGPITLRVCSHERKILMTEISYHNQPILKKPISKHTDIRELRKNLKLLA